MCINVPSSVSAHSKLAGRVWSEMLQSLLCSLFLFLLSFRPSQSRKIFGIKIDLKKLD